MSNLSDYRSISAISGDGAFHELVNGFVSRPDWQQLANIPLGIVGAGSANAVGKNTDTIDPASAVMAIIKMKTLKADIFAYIQDSVVSYSHLNILWAFIADIDIESEKWRSLGDTRFVVAALQRLFKFRNYNGVLYMLEPLQAAKHEIPPNERCGATGLQCRYIKPGKDHYKNWPIRIESQFQYFVASNMPWISADFLSSPDSLLDDGLIDVQYGMKMSRGSVLPVVLDQSTGNHVDLPFIERHKVKAFVLEPLGYDEKTRLTDLILDVSGERIEYRPIQVEILEKAINLIVAKNFDKSKWLRKYQAKHLSSIP